MLSIVGFSGRQLAGKTTAAKYVADYYDGLKRDVAIISFADYLKHTVARCVFRTNMFREEFKDLLKDGRTGRQWCQDYGKAMRAINPNSIVNAWLTLLGQVRGMTGVEIVLVPDVRMPEEAEIIHQLQGKIVRFTRCPVPEDEDVTEVSLSDTFEGFDAVIDNKDMTLEDKDANALDLIVNNGWVHADDVQSIVTMGQG